MPDIVNVVGGGDLQRGIRLEKVYEDMSAPTVRYDPETFAGLYIKFEEAGPAVMLFASGKYNIAGAPSAESLRDAHKQLIDTLIDLGIKIDPSQIEVEIRNRVYVDDCGYELDLEMLLPDLGFENTEYDSEIFPGIMYRPKQGGLLTIFRSGKIMLMGLSDPEKASHLIEQTNDKINVLLSNNDQ